MKSPSQRSRASHRKDHQTRSNTTAKTPLSPSNADPCVNHNSFETRPKSASIEPDWKHSTPFDNNAVAEGPNVVAESSEPHYNSENQILSSVARLIDSLKLDSSQQQSASLSEKLPGHDAKDAMPARKDRPGRFIEDDDVSSLASPVLSPRSHDRHSHAAARRVDDQTLVDVAKFVQLLQTNEKTASVGHELDQIVKSMSDESLDCKPPVKLSPATLEALGMFIDHVSKEEARRREAMPPTRVFVPRKIQSNSQPRQGNPYDETKSATAYEVQSIRTHDLHPEALSILGRYIDVVAETPRTALSHWGNDPPSLRRGESEIVFYAAPLQGTNLDDTTTLPRTPTKSQMLSPASDYFSCLRPFDDDPGQQSSSHVFSFGSMDSFGPRPPPANSPSNVINESSNQKPLARSPQEPGGASMHILGPVEPQKWREELDLLPALTRLRVADIHAPPRDAPTDMLSLSDISRDDPPTISSDAVGLRLSREPEYNLNRQYWTETELKLQKRRNQPESPRKRLMRDSFTANLICPTVTASDLAIGKTGDQSIKDGVYKVEVVDAELRSLRADDIDKDVVDACMEQTGIDHFTNEIIFSVQQSNSILSSCGVSLLEQEPEEQSNEDQPGEVSNAVGSRYSESASAVDKKSKQPMEMPRDASTPAGICYQQEQTFALSPEQHQVSSEDEKKVDDVTEDMMNSEEIRQLLSSLYSLLSENAAPPTDADIQNFRTLISLAVPFYANGSLPTAVERARIQVQARRRHVPIALTNAFLEAVQTLSETEIALGIQQTEMSTPRIEDGSNSSAAKMYILLRRLFIVKQAESSRDVVIYSLTGVGSQEGEAVEVDLNGHFGFARKDYGDAEEILSDSEPWWEAAARLSRQAQKQDPLESRPLDPPPASLGSSSDDSAPPTGGLCKNANKTLDDDIDGFWQNQSKINKRKYGRPVATRKWRNEQWATSYSNTDNESSLRSKSSSSSGFSAISARSLLSQEDEWILRRSYAVWPKKFSTKLQFWMNGSMQKDMKVGKPPPINAVDSVRFLDPPGLLRRQRAKLPRTKQWKRTYVTRTEGHPGYFDVDIKSLYVHSAVRRRPHRLDNFPWEHRDVRQRFLFEQSISYNRNWFGVAHKVYGNDTVIEPICFPRSMEMPTKAEEWTEEWYSKPVPTLVSQSTGENSKDVEEMREIRRKYLLEDDFDLDPDPTQWEENPECGRIRNVKLKIGERVSRVTPDLTSSLRRSRWRKKYFPKGTFPY